MPVSSWKITDTDDQLKMDPRRSVASPAAHPSRTYRYQGISANPAAATPPAEIASRRPRSLRTAHNVCVAGTNSVKATENVPAIASKAYRPLRTNDRGRSRNERNSSVDHA